MVEKILAFYSSDSCYATRLMEYVNQRKNSEFTLSVFTKRESLEEYLCMYGAELLLLGEEIELKEDVIDKVKYIYQLTEKEQDQSDTDHSQIFKYQAAGKLMDELIADYEAKEYGKGNAMSLKGCKIISIFAPIAGMTEHSFALALSMLFAQKEKTLLIILDPLPVPFCTELSSEGNPLTEFIYYLKEGFDQGRMNSLLRQSGRLYYLAGVEHGADLMSIGKENIHAWLSGIRATTEYRNILFYVGCYSEAMLELMKESDAILAISHESDYEVAVLEEWERQLCCSYTNAVKKRINYIKLPEENRPEKFPMSLLTLTQGTAWNVAMQYLKH